jgi:hypothetical protein
VQCTKDADCKDVGADATCADSICRRKASITTQHDSGAPLTCNEITTEAQNALQPLRDGADESCQSDADCTEFPGLSCTNGCATVTISKSGLAAIQSHIDQVEAAWCTTFQKDGCTVLEPPCAFPGTPGCVNHKCRHVLPGAPQSDAGSCDSEANQINNTLLDALDRLDKSCNVDADCTRVQPELSCEYGCPVDVSTTAAAAFASMRADYETNLCASFNAQGCTPPPDGCLATQGDAPKCVEGVCIEDFTMTTDRFAGMSCDQRTAQLTTELQGTVGVADTRCTKDADCASVMLVNNCMESCTYAPASTSGAQEIRAELAAIELEYCPWFTQAGCTVQRLPCVSPPLVKCNAGVCSTQ